MRRAGHAAGEIARLQKFRAVREPGVAIGAAARAVAEGLERERRLTGGLAGAWAALCPPELAGRSRVVRFVGGVVTVEVTDGATRFRVDRWLRSGGRAALQDRAGGIRRVVMRVRNKRGG
ncbi:MAG: DciA family protein [Phycisphaerales bacterium]|nr:DciA family protein [Phycisphaerales bacterium]